MAVIEIKNLKKHYGKARGIEDVTFSVEEGEFFGFIGPNGAGKSTTIRTLLALIRPTAGHAEIFGKDCQKFAPEIALQVGYLPSEVFYYDGMRVGELLKYSASFYKKDCATRLRRLADALDLDLKKKIDDLSFGNKKKVGIVQSLLHEPRLLLLDEPSSGLDPLMQQTFYELLAEENKKGVTILFSSHVLSEVQKLCGRVAIIKEGKILQVEDLSSLRESSYKKVSLETKPGAEAVFKDLTGVTNLTAVGGSVSFLYRGGVNALMKLLAGLSLDNVTIAEPDLEEIFLHYYR